MAEHFEPVNLWRPQDEEWFERQCGLLGFTPGQRSAARELVRRMHHRERAQVILANAENAMQRVEIRRLKRQLAQFEDDRERTAVGDDA